jgi:hypothetical protein
MPYGANTDWFGIAATGINLQSSSKGPKYNIDASVQDSVGDFACRNKGDTETEFTCTYRLQAGGDTNGSHSIDALAKVGEVKVYDTSTSIQVTGVDGNTDNRSFPLVTVKGVKEKTAGQTHAEFTTGISLVARKAAQKIGLGAITGKITAASFSVSGNLTPVQDSQGVTLKREPDGVRVVAQNTLQTCSGATAAVADTAGGWKLETPKGDEETNTDYGTSSIAVFKDLTRDT